MYRKTRYKNTGRRKPNIQTKKKIGYWISVILNFCVIKYFFSKVITQIRLHCNIAPFCNYAGVVGLYFTQESYVFSPADSVIGQVIALPSITSPPECHQSSVGYRIRTVSDVAISLQVDQRGWILASSTYKGECQSLIPPLTESYSHNNE